MLRFLKNEVSTNYIYEYFKVNKYVLNKCGCKYCAHGMIAKDGNYSKELKIQAVLKALDGIPILDILNKYDISIDTFLYKWIKLYNSHKELENSRGKTQIMDYRK